MLRLLDLTYEPLTIETDVLVIGAGGAGMYAALAAAESAHVVLLDKNMIGRGGATVMAQMTVAAAMAELARTVSLYLFLLRQQSM